MTGTVRVHCMFQDFTYCTDTDSQAWVMHEALDLAGTWVDWVVFPHNSGLRRFSAFCCHYPLWPDTAPCCKFRPLTDMLANHTGVMRVSVRKIVCTPVFPRQDLNSRPHHWH